MLGCEGCTASPFAKAIAGIVSASAIMELDSVLGMVCAQSSQQD